MANCLVEYSHSQRRLSCAFRAIPRQMKRLVEGSPWLSRFSKMFRIADMTQGGGQQRQSFGPQFHVTFLTYEYPLLEV